ncbi:MAG: DUF4286 family protein [Bacteroidia bacterium]|nr:DUF4286 family protein [Bacteroidia bacterium]MDW8015722.1 DUF4286 family protein [Bacteroidia bacterium]
MLIYAVRVEIEVEVAEAWRYWMLHTHIPEVLQTGFFRGHRFGEMIDPPPPSGRRVFLVMYEAGTEADLKAYLEREAPRLRSAYPPEFKERFQAQRWIWQMS